MYDGSIHSFQGREFVRVFFCALKGVRSYVGIFLVMPIQLRVRCTIHDPRGVIIIAEHVVFPKKF